MQIGCIMYIRFVTPGQGPERGVAPGFFRSDHAWDFIDEAPRYLRDAIRTELDWFNNNLPIPTDLTIRSKRRWRALGICWFQAQHTETVSRGWALAVLMKEAGAHIHVLKTREPGTIIYKDEQQIVARPCEWTPRAYTHRLH
jgi:hypothetical protein